MLPLIFHGQFDRLLLTDNPPLLPPPPPPPSFPFGPVYGDSLFRLGGSSNLHLLAQSCQWHYQAEQNRLREMLLVQAAFVSIRVCHQAWSWVAASFKVMRGFCQAMKLWKVFYKRRPIAAQASPAWSKHRDNMCLAMGMNLLSSESQIWVVQP